MSLTRAALVVVQAFANGTVSLPPHPTSQKQRYHTEQWYVLQLAPAVFKYQTFITYLCALFEVLFYLSSTFTASTPSTLSTLICPAPSITTWEASLLRATPMFLLGVLTVVLGAVIRWDCFKTLGHLFTFDLTVQPDHQLVTEGLYGYVRHPSYTGGIFLVFGLALSHLTRGSWLTECGPLAWTGGEKIRLVIWATWWLWISCVVIDRAVAEDEQLRKVFNEEWDDYAEHVPWWFLPGLI